MACTTFTPITTIARPSWSLKPTNPAIWTAVPPITSLSGFGFGQGGFGQGGFGGGGTQAGTSRPVWTVLGTAFASVFKGIALLDSLSRIWTVTVGPNGNLITTLGATLPINTFFPETMIVLVDSNGNYWNLTIGVGGNLITTSITLSGTAIHFSTSILLLDSNCRTWTLTVNTTGHLVTT